MFKLLSKTPKKKAKLRVFQFLARDFLVQAETYLPELLYEAEFQLLEAVPNSLVVEKRLALM